MEKRLSPLQVAKLTEPGRHCDGGNLNLMISITKKGTISKRWTFLYNRGGKQREMGLGSTIRVSLAQARAKAAKARALLDRGIDPLDQKTTASKPPETFRERANAYVDGRGSAWSPTHLHQWRKSIDDYLAPIANMPCSEIDTEVVLKVLKPLWQKMPETASRLRGRIEAVLDSAKVLGLRSGENPAAWRGHLALILPGRSRLEKIHYAAMPYGDVTDLIRSLRNSTSTAARALEFAILTAARSGEARGAKWSEIDLDAQIWTIPTNRMKAGREHRVPLSGRAIEILEHLAETRSSDFVFAGRKAGFPIGKVALGKICPRGATVHGFRSAFRDWAGNCTSFPREVAEQALAHATGNAVELAYRRGDALERRRELMAAWASYVEPAAVDNVIRMRG